jgi:hypothetical protein
MVAGAASNAVRRLAQATGDTRQLGRVSDNHGELTKHRVMILIRPAPDLPTVGQKLGGRIPMRNIKKAAVLTIAAAGLVASGAGVAAASSGAEGVAAGSPGVLSGNLIQVPVHVPVNLCGNTVDVIGALNPAFGNSCANVG